MPDKEQDSAVTPAMIAAGVAAFLTWVEENDNSHASLVVMIYRAMVARKTGDEFDL